MIKPITKEYFYSQVGEVPEWKKIYNFEFKNFSIANSPRFVRSTKVLYFEKPDGFFAYLPGLSIIAIPKQYDSLGVWHAEEFDFSDWTWEKTGKGHNEEYTKNLFKRASSRYSNDWLNETFVTLNDKYPGRCEIHLENKKIGFSKNIELMFTSESWNKEVLIAYEEKLALPFNGKEIERVDTEIKNILLWSQKKH